MTSDQDAGEAADQPADEDESPGPTGPVVYGEKARSYASVLPLLAVFGVAFGFDVYLGGGVSHIPGWIIATVLVVGIYALMIGAARSTRSLVLTEDELWVGEEVLPRAEIAGQRPGIEHRPDLDVPLLGWPTGRSGRPKGITVRTVDDTDVAVATRFPQRLIAALDVPLADIGGPAVVIRAAEPEDLPLLGEIDDRAEVLFAMAGYSLPDIEFDTEALDGALAVFVAGEPPVAFACVIEVDGLAHLQEIAVVPGSMRKGLGSRLLERACDWAAEQDYPAITLTTYADVPWNGPYYAARGFVACAATAGLAQIRDHEAQLGLDAVGPRIVMRRALPPPPANGAPVSA
ncbi:MAG: GNAT family N-acetyltransferase [Jatrophihabitans sp.]